MDPRIRVADAREVAALLVGIFFLVCGAAEPAPLPAGEPSTGEPTTYATALPTAGSHAPSRVFGEPPAIPSGPLGPELSAALGVVFGENLREGLWGPDQDRALEAIAGSGDARAAWLLSDLLRIATDPALRIPLTAAVGRLLQRDIGVPDAWRITTDHLIAWDVPAPPGYLPLKRALYTLIVPEWERLFQPGDIDWRHVSWGGVGIDDRPFGATDRPCNCIPAADDPEVSDAAGAAWLEPQHVVFGIAIGGEARAYPRRIMEAREMVNDTLGGRDLAIPYCTLCGSAQAYFTDRLPKGVARPVFRTSGLLIRSNKVMYDVNTFTVFDTFRGRAVVGPLAERGIALERVGVVTTTWGEWKAAHPRTTVLVEALALGRNFDFRNGRDANGPIFPIGDVDPRLPVQEEVLGVVTGSGVPVAFHVGQARAVLERGGLVSHRGIRLVLDGGGFRALDEAGRDLGGHQAFWFAWSQFYPRTELWPL